MKQFLEFWLVTFVGVTLAAEGSFAADQIKTIQFDDLEDGQVINQPVAGVSIAISRDDENQVMIFDSRRR